MIRPIVGIVDTRVFHKQLEAHGLLQRLEQHNARANVLLGAHERVVVIILLRHVVIERQRATQTTVTVDNIRDRAGNSHSKTTQHKNKNAKQQSCCFAPRKQRK